MTGVCLYLLLKKDEEWSDERSHVTSRHVVLEVCTYHHLKILKLFKVSYLPDSMQVKIPKDSVGIVIGRQGANIREIQVKTPSP